MAQLKSLDLPDSERTPVRDTPQRQSASGHTWIWILVAALALGGFWYYRSSRSKAAQDAAAPAAPGKGAGRGPGGANFSVPVVVATTTKGDLPVYLNGLGTVTPLSTVTVRSRVDGQLINVAFKEGQYVKAGDLLERFKLLFKEGVIPKQQLDTQAASVGQFDGAIKSDQAQIDNAKLQLTYSRITAPISGRIGLRLVDPGNIVHATDTNGLLIITQLQPISVIFTLPQDQLPQVFDKLHKGAAQLTVEAFDRDNTAKIATGKLLTIDNQIDVATGTYKLKAVFNNEDSSLFPNQFVNTHLLVDTKRNLSLVPLAALQRGPQGSTYVYVVANNTVKIHNITVAQTTGGTVGVSDGLQPGELVVTDGQDKLQEGTKVIPNQAPAAAPAAATSTPSANPTYSNSSAPAATPPTPPSAKHGRGAKP